MKHRLHKYLAVYVHLTLNEIRLEMDLKTTCFMGRAQFAQTCSLNVDVKYQIGMSI